MSKAVPAKKSTCSATKVALGAVAGLAVSAGVALGVVFGLGLHLQEDANPLAGHWLTNWNTHISVKGGAWYAVSSWGTSVYTIESHTDAYVIMQNPADDAYNPSLWSKVEYHWLDESAGTWAYCTSVFNGATAEEALATDTVGVYDATDQAAGCNGYPHTTVAPFALPIAGAWTTNWDESLQITEETYTNGDAAYPVEAFGASYLLMQNPDDDAYNPSKWTKMEFHPLSADSYGFCLSVYDGADATAALTAATASIYNASDAGTGCNGFPHSIMTRVA
jgi:hypothetical protein